MRLEITPRPVSCPFLIVHIQHELRMMSCRSFRIGVLVCRSCVRSVLCMLGLRPEITVQSLHRPRFATASQVCVEICYSREHWLGDAVMRSNKLLSGMPALVLGKRTCMWAYLTCAARSLPQLPCLVRGTVSVEWILAHWGSARWCMSALSQSGEG